MSVVFIAGAVWLFLFSIMLMVEAINSFGFSLADYVINTTANPFIGLFIGLLATALFQSSSTSTTITVAAVASGTLSLQGAIPIILGANIGTTLTSTIVSMGYITKANEFRKAVAAGTIHDLFNILLVVFFFPIEMRYHVLENGSKFIASLLVPQSDFLLTPNISVFPNFEEIASWLVFYLGALGTLILAGLLLFACIKLISRLLYDILIGGTKKKFTTAIFSSTIRSFGWGLFITSVAQSSSLTTSLIVPLVATGKVKLKRAFQFVMGANIGTTITALLAAVFQTKVAIEVALVHLLFNLLGVLLFLSIPFLSRLVIFLADKMGQYTLRIRLIGLAYIVITFFLLPFTLIYISEGFEKKAEAHEISTEK
ncbi:MAG: Na/Pi symporter [Bacteroidota bacterium]